MECNCKLECTQHLPFSVQSISTIHVQTNVKKYELLNVITHHQMFIVTILKHLAFTVHQDITKKIFKMSFIFSFSPPPHPPQTAE